MKKVFLFFILTLFLTLSAACQKEIVILSYNVQNLFDDVNDGAEYKEFIPGTKSWNSALYHKRMTDIARVIRSTNPSPDIILLQEIENINALTALNKNYLGGYPYAVMVPVKGLAANTAVLARLPVKQVNTFQVPDFGGFPLRNITEVNFEYNGHKLFVFNNHWKSKANSDNRTEKVRVQTAAILVNRLKAVLEKDSDADIVVAGDFNENYDEYKRVNREFQTAIILYEPSIPESWMDKSLLITTNPADLAANSRLMLYSPWEEVPEDLRGSIVYNDKWESIDNFFLSRGLFDQIGFSFVLSSFSVSRPDFILDQNGNPFAWRNDNKGFSDHLPIIIKLKCQ